MTEPITALVPGDELPLAPICSPCAGNEDGRCCGTGECWLCPLSTETNTLLTIWREECERAPGWLSIPLKAKGLRFDETALVRIGGAIEAAVPESFQARVAPWMRACFGAQVSRDRTERSHRFLEEALELVQAAGCTSNEAHQLVDYVFGRPVGDLRQEVGGVMVTLAALCLAQDVDMHAAGETELARVWTKIDIIRAKQAAKPKHSPLPGAAPPVLAPAEASEFGDRDRPMNDDELQDFCIACSFDQDDYTVDVIRNVERRMLGQPLFECSVMSNAEMDATPSAPQAPQAEAVGEAGEMPGTSGFTMACFKAVDVPAGTKLYAAPPSSTAQAEPCDHDWALPVGASQHTCTKCFATQAAPLAPAASAVPDAPSVPWGIDHATGSAAWAYGWKEGYREALLAAQPSAQAVQSAKPIARVEKHTGSLKDMAIIVWLGEQPPEGTLLYTEALQAGQADALDARRLGLLTTAAWSAISALERTHHVTDDDRFEAADELRAAIASQRADAGEVRP